MSAEEGLFKSRGEGQKERSQMPEDSLTHSGTSRLLALSGWRESHPAYTHIPASSPSTLLYTPRNSARVEQDIEARTLQVPLCIVL